MSLAEDSDPDWSHLPRDPQRFFRLADNFDRRELKTTYGQYIRRFKPEQHPAEFQKIRAAYEQLDLQLRYGATVEASASAAADWRAVNSPPESPEVASAPSAFRPLHVRLQNESPEILYQELAGLTYKTPYDCYALALLSDVVTPASDCRFASWLISGIADSPHELALHCLLQRYFQDPIPTEFLPKILTQAARQLTELYFYPLTERLWRRLLHEQGFPVFHETLIRCLDFQPGIQIGNRLTFYLQILRHAVWVADPAWIKETTAYIEEHFQQIPYQLGDEIDLLLALQNYAAHRATFISRHPLRTEMDAVIRSYFTEEEYLADRKMINCQAKFLADPRMLAAAFPEFNEPGINVFFSLWAWLSRDAADRNFGRAPNQHPDPLWGSQTRALVIHADHLANWSLFGLSWTAAKFGFLALMVVGFFAIPIFLALLVITVTYALSPLGNAEGVLGLIIIPTLLAGTYLGKRFCRYETSKWTEPYEARMITRCYREYWQPEVLKFMAASHLSVESMVKFLDKTTRYTTRDRLISFIRRDYALAVYSLAQRYLS
jgi:hypothetical protein